LKIQDDLQGLTLQNTFPALPANFAIQSLHVSSDGAWLAAERSGAESGSVQIYSITDDYKHWWSLPALESPVTSVRFLDGEKASLVVSCASCAVYVFEMEERRLNSWSEKQGIPMRNALPKELSHRADFPVRGVSPCHSCKSNAASFALSEAFPLACGIVWGNNLTHFFVFSELRS